MKYKVVALASRLSMGVATAAYVGEVNNELLPLSISTGSGSQTMVSTLSDANGLPAGALTGTPFYQQAQ